MGSGVVKKSNVVTLNRVGEHLLRLQALEKELRHLRYQYQTARTTSWKWVLSQSIEAVQRKIHFLLQDYPILRNFRKDR